MIEFLVIITVCCFFAVLVWLLGAFATIGLPRLKAALRLTRITARNLGATGAASAFALLCEKAVWRRTGIALPLMQGFLNREAKRIQADIDLSRSRRLLQWKAREAELDGIIEGNTL